MAAGRRFARAESCAGPRLSGAQSGELRAKRRPLKGASLRRSARAARARQGRQLSRRAGRLARPKVGLEGGGASFDI